MIIIDLSLWTIFFCSLFIVISKRIETHPAAKGIMCFLMVSIVGVLAKDSHKYVELSETVFAASIALLVLYETYTAWKRGSL